MFKLNLGCGRNPLPDYVNIDIVNYPGVNIVYDISKLNDVVAESIADEILAKDVIEHFNIKDVYPMLCTWSKLLKKDGIIILEFPDAKEHCKQLLSGYWNMDRFNYQFFSQREPGQIQGEDWNLHKSAYDDKSITELLNSVGIEIKLIEHFKTPSTYNMRVVGVKK